MVHDDRPTTKHTLHLYQGDYADLMSMYPEIGAALVIRKLVRRHIEEMSPKTEFTIKPEINL